MRTSWLDLRYAFRMIAKRPGYSGAAVLILALGIGLNTAVFSLVDGIALKPLPVRDPAELVRVYAVIRDHPGNPGPMSSADYEDLRDESRSFSDLAAYFYTTLALERQGESRLIMGELVTPNYFSTLGVRPALGSTFVAREEDVGGADDVAVLSYLAWTRRFHADPRIVGEVVDLNGRPFTVIGVAPQEFFGLTHGVSPELWIPLGARNRLRPSSPDSVTPTDPFYDRRSLWLWVIGRLAPGVPLRRAEAEIGGLADQLRRAYPDTNAKRRFITVPANQVRILPGVDTLLTTGSFIVMGLVTLVLLVTCANVANMLLARAIDRQREMATRLSLGAGAGALVRQLLTESLVLSLIGGAAGLVLAWLSIALLNGLRLPLPVDVALGVSLDARTLLFSVIVAVSTALIFGLAPAIHASRVDLVTALHGALRGVGGGRSRGRLTSIIVVAQIAVSLLLLICAGLSLRSMANAQRVDPGLDPACVVVATFAPHLQGYTPDETEAFYRRLGDRVRALPGVRSVGFTSHLPLSFEVHVARVRVHAEGEGAGASGEWHEVDEAQVGPGLLETLRIPLLAGRSFTEGDTKDSPPVAVVNETLAGLLGPGDSAVGKRLRMEDMESNLEIIGVVRDGKYRTLGESSLPFLYRALAQDSGRAGGEVVTIRTGTRTLVARVDGEPHTALMPIRRAAKELDESIAISRLTTLEEAMSAVLMLPRIAAAAFSLFGLLALTVACVGIYGVTAYAVGRRTHEIGIRMAMGAEGRDIELWILKGAVTRTAVGLGIGLVGAVAATRLLSSLLFDVSPTDVWTLTLVPLFLAVVALLSTYIPARRAARIAPLRALHHE